MGTQDNTERVLRSLHVMLSKSETYRFDTTKVLIDRQIMVDLLTELNRCIYAMMNEYEVTKESRDQAERAFQKHGDQIVWDANRKAEDVYAASVMYTDEALSSVQNIMGEAAESIKQIYKDMEERLEAERQVIRSNQTELKSQLQNLVDTEKYLKLIEERNREIKKEKKAEKTIQKKEPSIYADRQTEIRVNTKMLERMGLSVNGDEEIQEDAALEQPAYDRKKASELRKPADQVGAVIPIEEEDLEIDDLIQLDLDTEFFKWKEEEDIAINGDSSGKEQKSRSDGIHKMLKSIAGGKR